MAAAKASKNGLERNRNLSKKNGRDIYTDKNGNLYSVDTQHGRFEKIDSKGRHVEEVD
jgi:hypothetical protein